MPGRLLLPPSGDGPFPLVLLQHGALGSKDEPYIDAIAGRWVRAGVAVLCIDFPLHGERASGKFRRLLLSGLGLEGRPDGEAAKRNVMGGPDEHDTADAPARRRQARIAARRDRAGGRAGAHRR